MTAFQSLGLAIEARHRVKRPTRAPRPPRRARRGGGVAGAGTGAAVGQAHRYAGDNTPQANAANFDALRKGLRELGYDESRSLIIEYGSADSRAERFPALAAELVRLNVDVIVTRGTPSAPAARNATRTIPIVMASVGDVIGTGLAVSLARPGGNVTGLTAINTDTEGNRLELLKEMVPGLVRIAVLYNMGNPSFALRWREVELAARAMGAESQLLDVRKPEDTHPHSPPRRRNAPPLLTSVDALIQANQPWSLRPSIGCGQSIPLPSSALKVALQ